MLAEPTRTAVYGPVRTVVWQGSAGDRRPYADLTGYPSLIGKVRFARDPGSNRDFDTRQCRYAG